MSAATSTGSAATSGPTSTGSATSSGSEASTTGSEASTTGSEAETAATEQDDRTSSDGETAAGETGDAPLSDRYPDGVGLADDPAVLFFDDFEAGWGRWSHPQEDTPYLHWENDAEVARRGSGYVRSTVTFDDLEQDEYISSQASIAFPRRTDEVFIRFFAQFVGVAPNPHHWVRVTAGTPEFSGSGLANTVPSGDDGFWFDFDAGFDDTFNFYVYWHEMRSGRCNDGSAVEGCPGDQGTTYYYGNVFRPSEQTSFPRDAWFCIEMRARANTLGNYDGTLTFWIDDALVGDFRPGHPVGTWLRSTFHPGGCTFSACTEPVPFEGFAFRTSEDVAFKAFVLDAYYERQSSADKRQALEEMGLAVEDAQTILYDDVVIATERIGCGP